MAVTKLPRTRKGMLSQGPPLSWPNDTVIGPHRSRFGLLKQATRNRQRHRISNLSANSKHNSPKLTRHPSLHSQAPRASGYSRYKAHNRNHQSKQQSKASSASGKPRKQTGKPVALKPPPHATQLPQASQVSSHTLIEKKEDAKSQKDSHTAPAKGINWAAYDRAKAHRLKQIRIWVTHLRRSHRIVDSVAKELMAYYGDEKKYGNHPSARSLSKHAWQAVKLCEHEFGTDLRWGKGLGEAVWGSEHGKVEALIEMKMEGEGEGTPGMGTVGESDLSEFEDEGLEEEDHDDDDGFWGDGEGEDVVMAETA